MSIIKSKRNGNLPGYVTDMPVQEFLSKFRRTELNVAGLLDYGYDEVQIAEELNLTLRHVHLIMNKYNYKTVDELPS